MFMRTSIFVNDDEAGSVLAASALIPPTLANLCAGPRRNRRNEGEIHSVSQSRVDTRNFPYQRIFPDPRKYPKVTS